MILNFFKTIILKIQIQFLHLTNHRSLKVRVCRNFYVTNHSPWPFFLSLSLFSLILNSIAFIHYYKLGFLGIVFSLFATLTIASLWWWDLIIETQNVWLYTSLIQKNLKLGMILFIISEIFFFFSFFWAFFHSSLSPSIAIGCVWPPNYFDVLLKIIDPWDIAIVNTAFLLTSGLLVSWGHHRLRLGDKEDAFFGIFFCLFCASFFIGWQFYEYYYERLLLCDGIYGSCFFMLTGFHGLHVIGGTIFLIVCITRLRLEHFHDGRQIGLDCAVWYWHFVDIVWIFLFIFLYVWGNYPFTGFDNFITF